MQTKPLILALGEVLWDLLPAGRVLGGAPANFAFHAAQLGADAHLVSAVGDDPLGREILGNLADLGLDTAHVAVLNDHPTGTVTVSVDPAGQPSYAIHEDVAWDHLAATPAVLALAARASAVCFGSLAQRHPASRRSIADILAATPATALRAFDINLRQHYYNRKTIDDSLRRTTLLKLNDAELPTVATLFELGPEPVADLFDRYPALRYVALTRGNAGSAVHARDGSHVEHPGYPVDRLEDTVGAGDAFTAALVVGLLAGRPLEAANDRANRVAAFVCTQRGATPRLPQELRN